MQGILDILDFFVTTLRSVYEFFTGFIDSLVTLVTYISRAFLLATDCIISMPVWLQVFAYITLSISILYLILGREVGKSNG